MVFRLNTGLLFIILVCLSLNNLKGQDEYFLRFGGNWNDKGLSIIEKPGGGYVIGGITRSFGSGSDDFYFLVLNSYFEPLIETGYGGPHTDRLSSVINLDNNQYGLFGQSWDFEVGGLNYNLTILNEFGDILDRLIYYFPGKEIGLKVVRTWDQGFLLIGMTSSYGNYGQFHLLKLDQDYNEEWSRHFGDNYRRDYAFDVVQNEFGYLVVGTFSGFYGMYAGFPDFLEKSDIEVIQTDRAGNKIWNYSYNGDGFDFGYSLTKSNGKTFVVGSSNSNDESSFNILLLVLDEFGHLIEERQFGGDGFEYGYKIITDDEENLVIVGVSSSFVDSPSLYVLKIDQDYNILFEKRFEGDDSVYGYDIIQNMQGNYVITGSYKLTDKDSDLFIAVIDSIGELIRFDANPVISSSEVTLYPNPCGYRKIWLKTNRPSQIIKTITLFDASGNLVLESKNDLNARQIPLDISELESGYYLVISEFEDGETATNKLIRY